MAAPSVRVPSRRVSETREGVARVADTSRTIPEEAAIALVYDGSTHAVMMGTPVDLEDFAIGFSLTEGIIASRSDLRELEIVSHEKGYEARMWLVPSTGRKQAERRRRMVGPTSCGLCGVDSLEAAVPPPRRVGTTATATPAEIHAALAAMQPAQKLNVETRAVHAAAFWDARAEALAFVREDVGRHNALDKLVGAVVTAGMDPARGFIVLTSRVSVEMIQKAAMLGAEIVVAVSAPTALALRIAEEAGITVVAIARADAFEIFTHPDRITLDSRREETARQEVRHVDALQH